MTEINKTLEDKTKDKNNIHANSALSKDIYKAFIASGYSKEQFEIELKKSTNIEALIDKLPRQHQETLIKRIKGHKKAANFISELKKSISLPKTLETEEDIFKAKGMFQKIIDTLSSKRGKQKASDIAFAIFKSEYGKAGIEKIRKSTKKTTNQSLGQLSDQFGNNDHTFVDSPERGWDHIKFKK